MTVDMGIENIPLWTVGDRMAKALKSQGVSVHEMADYLGVTRQTVGNWMNDRAQPRMVYLRAWALRTGVPLQWLENGTAPETTNGPEGGTTWVAGGSNPEPTD
ncbi:MAG: helix-turn-helix domain-containing protein [Actinomycetes bacterium]